MENEEMKGKLRDQFSLFLFFVLVCGSLRDFHELNPLHYVVIYSRPFDGDLYSEKRSNIRLYDYFGFKIIGTIMISWLN